MLCSLISEMAHVASICLCNVCRKAPMVVILSPSNSTASQRDAHTQHRHRHHPTNSRFEVEPTTPPGGSIQQKQATPQTHSPG